MASKNPRKAASSMRTASALNNREAGSVAASVGNQDAKKRNINIWPEWNDADVNAEKWEVAHRGAKKEEKGKSPVVQHFFDDPEGKIDLPTNFKVSTWKRPQDFITDKTPVIVEDEGKFDLLTPNEYIHQSELMRWITSQLEAVWRQSELSSTTGVPGTDPAQLPADPAHTWHPWEHIYAINKVAKGPNVPVYNPHGKYVIKLYWMGCWRKIIIDDTIPFDEEDRMLLPATSLQHELWPMLLTKALLKVANLDLSGGSTSCEFGDFSTVHCVTGWLPEVIPLQPGHCGDVWELIKAAVPEFKLPEPVEDPEGEGAEPKDPNTGDALKDDKSEKDKEKSGVEKSDGKPAKDGKEKGKDKEKSKDDKKDKKDKDKDKDKGKEKSIVQEEQPLPEHPELMVFASYYGPPKYPVRISVLREMANASECLRKTGLSHLYPHPVMVTQSRSCPLEPPPPQEKVPSWKLIRPRKKRTTPSDEGLESEDDRPIQCVKITSPFLNYKVSPVPIPTDTHRPNSSLRRGGSRVSSRPGTANADSIQEGEEDRPDEPATPVPTNPVPAATPTTPTPPADTDKTQETPKPPTPVKESKRSGAKSASRSKMDSQSQEAGKTSTGKPATGKPVPKRVGSSTGRSDKDAKTAADTKKDAKTDVTPSKDKPGSGAPVDSVSEGVVQGVPPGEPTDTTLPETDTVDTPGQPNTDNVWMDYQYFYQCFKTLYVFHKSNTYPNNYKHTDMKTATEDRQPSFLFVDSLTPTNIVVSYSAISRWNEPIPVPPKEESKTGLKSSKEKMGDRDSKAEALTVDTSSVIDGDMSPLTADLLQPGLLTAETYSWKSLISGQLLLRVRTTGIRAAVLSLPEGRHLLKFSMSAPYGYHLHLSSSFPFVFGDEEKVMEQLTKESCRFQDNAVQVMNHLGQCIQAFTDPLVYEQAYEGYEASHCPYRHNPKISKKHHYKVYNEALYDMLRKVIPDPTPEIAFSWRAFNFDCTSKNILKLSYGSNSRPATGVTSSDRGSAGGKKGTKKKETTDNKTDHPWKNREATPEEHVAVIKLQKCWRGAYVRKIKAARTPGTELNQKVQETLLKSWAALEAAQEQNGLLLFRAMFKMDPNLMVHYPFYKDEWNKISFCDYQGTYPDLTPNSWFVLFREIFYVSDEMMCVPKLYTSLPSCTLRVINNDTGAEIPRVFHKVAPAEYKKNKSGYTFVAEAHTPDLPTLAGKWRLRVIGALPGLPAPTRNEINSSFLTKDLRDYYVPNDKNNILRYTVRVQEDQQLSFQLVTSKSDVLVRLSILDHDTEIVSVNGKGQVILPAVTFLKEPASGESEESKRSNSRSSIKAKGSRDNLSKAGKRVSSGRSTRSSSSRHSITSMDEDMDKSHKYMVQAQVLHNSWPLSESQWTFVGMLKDLEKNEIKLAQKENGPTSPQRNDKQSATASKSSSKDKGSKGKKDKEKSSRPPSQQFDASKPNWILRVVCDSAYVDDLEIKKDTERVDEIRAMKKAWEDAEPGRAAKAVQSRLQYLNNHIIQTKPEEEEAEPSADTEGLVPGVSDGAVSPVPTLGLDALDSDTVLTLQPPAPPPPKEVLPLIDLTPYLRNTNITPRLQDEDQLADELAERQAEIQLYRDHRASVEKHREEERAARNQAKIQQLVTFEHMQATLDAAREAVNNPRQAFRQRYLEAERKRLEEIAAQEALLRSEMEKAPTPKGRKSAKGDKKTPSAKKKK